MKNERVASAEEQMEQMAAEVLAKEEFQTFSHHMYAIRDVKAEAFLSPFFAKTDGIAIRMVEQAVNDPSSDFAKYPEDYALYRVGSWDELNGTVNGAQLEKLIQLAPLLKEV